jgi:hypothetical protein
MRESKNDFSPVLHADRDFERPLTEQYLLIREGFNGGLLANTAEADIARRVEEETGPRT